MSNEINELRIPESGFTPAAWACLKGQPGERVVYNGDGIGWLTVVAEDGGRRVEAAGDFEIAEGIVRAAEAVTARGDTLSLRLRMDLEIVRENLRLFSVPEGTEFHIYSSGDTLLAEIRYAYDDVAEWREFGRDEAYAHEVYWSRAATKTDVERRAPQPDYPVSRRLKCDLMASSRASAEQAYIMEVKKEGGRQLAQILKDERRAGMRALR